MSPDQHALYEYIFTERLNILCQGAEPTQEQMDIAKKDAEKAVQETPL